MNPTLNYIECFIYKCSQTVNGGYDTHDAFVCVARSEEEARNMNPYGDWTDTWLTSWCRSPDQVTVELLGATRAPESNLPFYVLQSFNAG